MREPVRHEPVEDIIVSPLADLRHLGKGLAVSLDDLAERSAVHFHAEHADASADRTPQSRRSGVARRSWIFLSRGCRAVTAG